MESSILYLLSAHSRTRASYEPSRDDAFTGAEWLHFDEPVSKEEWQTRFDELVMIADQWPILMWPAGAVPPNAQIQLSEIANGRLGLPHALVRKLDVRC